MTPYLIPHSLNVQWWIQNNMYDVPLEQGRRITEYTEKLLAHSNFKFSQGSFPDASVWYFYSSLGMILPGFVSVLGLQFPPLRHVSFFIRKLTLQLIIFSICVLTFFLLCIASISYNPDCDASMKFISDDMILVILETPKEAMRN